MSRTVLVFADCRLDVAARSLTRAGERVDVPPIVFDCIAYLVTQRERAVGRDELVAAVWGKSAISDTMLGKAILAARRAVGDTADDQALIRTVPRFGYHWVGAVRVEADDGVAIPAPRVSDIKPPRRAWLAIGAIAVIAIVAASIYFFREGQPPGAADIVDAPAGASAVLPVEVLAGPDDAWLRLGLMDLIANRLRESGVPVMSSDSLVSLLRRNGADANRLRKVLRDAHPDIRLVEASIAKRGDGWMLHAKLGDHAIDANGADPVAAARAGADRLLEVLGRHPPVSAHDGSGDLTLDALMQRTEAARLADDLDIARGLIENAPDALKSLPEVRLRRAQIEMRAGRFDDAQNRLQQLLAEAPVETDAALRARILANLCSAESQLGRADDAIRDCSAAIDLGGANGAAEPAAVAYNNRAITHSRRREFAAAQADFARARVAFERSGDMLALVRLDGNEASMLMGRGRPAEALPVLERAGRQFESFGLANESLIAIANEVDANRSLLRATDALAASERGWAILPRVQDPNLRNQFKRERAEALAGSGRIAEAHALLDALIGEIDPARDGETLALVRASQAAIELDNGQSAIAAVLAHQAVATLPPPEYDSPRAEAARNEILALHRLGRDSDAATASSELTRWAESANTPVVSLYAELSAAELAASAVDADPHYERALAIAADLNLPSQIATAAVAYGQTLIARGELERAAIVAGRVSRYVETDYASALLQARLYRALGEREPWQAALTRARGLAGERRIPAQVADFAAAANLADTPPNALRTRAE